METSHLLTPQEFAEKIAAQIRSLPAMPETAARLRVLLAKEDSNSDEIIALLERDPGICVDLIRIANSPFYGMSGRVETLVDAVLTLGMVHLSDFVAVAYSNKIIRSHFSKIEKLGDYFSHSTKVSGAAYLLARLSGASPKDREMCKLGGLLHNIGRLLIAVALEDWKMPMDHGFAEESKQLESYLKLDACQVGMEVCIKWNFPDVLVRGIGRHHSPVLGDDVNYVALVIYLSEFLVIETLPIELIVADFDAELLARLNLSENILEEAREAYKHTAKLLMA